MTILLRFLLVSALLAGPGAVHAMEVQCGSEGGDALGWALAAGGDWNGDGIADFAAGAPCASVGNALRVGRVRIFSGKTGALLKTMRGGEAEQQFGASLAWVPDLNGDGRSELAIGSATFAVPRPVQGVYAGAGKLELFSSTGALLWAALGENASAALGESVVVLPDVNGDGKADLVAGASGALVDGKAQGSGYLLSGATGARIAQKDGTSLGEQWASVVGAAGDLDGDGRVDWFAATRIGSPGVAPVEAPPVSTTTSSTTTTTTTLNPRAGHLKVYSGKSPYALLQTYRGQEWWQRLGREAAGAGDVDGDQVGDLWIGSPGSRPEGLENAGTVQLYSGDGTVLRELTEPAPQRSAGFGTAVVVPGLLNAGPIRDVVVGAPLAKVLGRAETGRVHAFAGESGNLLWTQAGSSPLERLGQTLAAGFDFNLDGTPDGVAGAPGGTASGRRGAGQVKVLSGKDGSVLATVGGRRGRETRIFVAGPGLDRKAVVQSYDPFGKHREAQFSPFRGQRSSALSMDTLDAGRRGETVNGSRTLLAVAAGPGGSGPQVAVYRAARRNRRVSFFNAGPDGYTGGLNLTAGDFGNLYDEEIAVAPADAVDGPIKIVIWRKPFGTDPFGRIQWTKVREFPAFSPTDKVDGTLINASGAYLASADLTTNEQHEILAAPVAGLPVIRLFSRIGTLVREWQAYPTDGGGFEDNSGVRVAIGNLDGEGPLEIVTAPARGQPWVRAVNTDGTPFQYASGKTVSFFVTQFGASYSGGLVVETADVDFDGSAEILVAPATGQTTRILAFEVDGTPVSGWATLEPFGPLRSSGVGLLGFDQFWKR
jgi:hypothetical protein